MPLMAPHHYNKLSIWDTGHFTWDDKSTGLDAFVALDEMMYIQYLSINVPTETGISIQASKTTHSPDGQAYALSCLRILLQISGK